MKKILTLLFVCASNLALAQELQIFTVTGAIPSTQAGTSLSHEHLLVDFIGAEKYSRDRWNKDEAFKILLPYLNEIKEYGVKTFFDCTPNFLGRDARLLQRLSKESGTNIVTNTGLYGGSDNKYLPAYAFKETSQQLAKRWIKEFKKGIDKTSVKPGFIKISVNSSSLSDISKKLITAAAITHKSTGLTIASHTGPAVAAKEQLEILKLQGVKPDAFIWVHAQNELEDRNYLELAKEGAWISLDGVSVNNLQWYADVLTLMKEENLLHRVLVSHDAGWYDPGKENGGTIRPYTDIFKFLIPGLKQIGFTQSDIDQLLIINPATAYSIQKRLIN
jgi:phosphotriesterase-related protein